MSKNLRSDEPQKTNIRISIKVIYPLAPTRDNDEYFEQRRSDSSLLIETLKELGATDYNLRYCMVMNGERTSRSEARAYFLTPDLREWTELGQFIVQVTAQISRSIAENKPTLENILTDSANITQITIPIITVIMYLLKRDKERRKSKQFPTVTITDGEKSVVFATRINARLGHENLPGKTRPLTDCCSKNLPLCS